MSTTCQVVRKSLSAALDGEAFELRQDEIELHLLGCDACRQWEESAHELTRQFRLRVADPQTAPPSVLSGMQSVFSPRRTLVVSLVRLALVAVAVAQVTVNLHLLTSGDIDGFRDLGALSMALGVGYLVAALIPRRAAGMRSIVGTASVLLISSATLDLMAHRTTLSDEAPHLITLAGWLLIVFLARSTPEVGTSPGTGLRSDIGHAQAWILGLGHRGEVDWSDSESEGRPEVALDRGSRAGAEVTPEPLEQPDTRRRAVGD